MYYIISNIIYKYNILPYVRNFHYQLTMKEDGMRFDWYVNIHGFQTFQWVADEEIKPRADNKHINKREVRKKEPKKTTNAVVKNILGRPQYFQTTKGKHKFVETEQ